MQSVDVAIIGGGIAGLSTAWYLQQQAPDMRYLVLEESARWGGKIRTDTIPSAMNSSEMNPDARDSGEIESGDAVRNGIGMAEQPFVVEGGPDAFITQKPWGLQLARELGLAERLLPTNDAQRQVYVVNRGKPTPLPDGVLLIVPTKFMPFAMSRLISPWGKLRMGLDLLIKPKRDGQDETLADFIRRRLGSEALDKIAEPLMSGIYNAEAERQSVLATFPRFRTLEEKHGSLIKGMLASRRMRPAPPKPDAPTPARPQSVFMSLQGGMNELVDTLVDQLTGDLRLSTKVESLAAQDGGYRLRLADGTEVQAQSVVLAIPAYIAAELMRSFAPAAANQLEQIRYVSTGTISLAFRRDEIDNPLNGFGVVIPRSEGRLINAVTWTSTKFNQRAPADAVLLRAFFGGSRHPEMMDHDDAALLAIVRRELAELLGIRATPLFHRIFRWHRANPQYDVGHLDRVDAVEAALPPGLFVTGSPYRGVGIPDCVHQAQTTAAAVAAHTQPVKMPA